MGLRGSVARRRLAEWLGFAAACAFGAARLWHAMSRLAPRAAAYARQASTLALLKVARWLCLPARYAVTTVSPTTTALASRSRSRL